MPTREEAIETLYELINSGILSEDITSKLENIANCIEAEDSENNLGISLWGVLEDDWAVLFMAYREDLWTDERIAKIQAIYDKYRIKG